MPSFSTKLTPAPFPADAVAGLDLPASVGMRRRFWLNAAEPELSALTRQCLDRRIATRKEVGQLARIWKHCLNRSHIGVDWQFTTDNARIKLRHLYPKMLN